MPFFTFMACHSGQIDPRPIPGMICMVYRSCCRLGAARYADLAHIAVRDLYRTDPAKHSISTNAESAPFAPRVKRLTSNFNQTLRARHHHNIRTYSLRQRTAMAQGHRIRAMYVTVIPKKTKVQPNQSRAGGPIDSAIVLRTTPIDYVCRHDARPCASIRLSHRRTKMK